MFVGCNALWQHWCTIILVLPHVVAKKHDQVHLRDVFLLGCSASQYKCTTTPVMQHQVGCSLDVFLALIRTGVQACTQVLLNVRYGANNSSSYCTFFEILEQL